MFTHYNAGYTLEFARDLEPSDTHLTLQRMTSASRPDYLALRTRTQTNTLTTCIDVSGADALAQFTAVRALPTCGEALHVWARTRSAAAARGGAMALVGAAIGVLGGTCVWPLALAAGVLGSAYGGGRQFLPLADTALMDRLVLRLASLAEEAAGLPQVDIDQIRAKLHAIYDGSHHLGLPAMLLIGELDGLLLAEKHRRQHGS